jgi:hypothetical protein
MALQRFFLLSSTQEGRLYELTLDEDGDCLLERAYGQSSPRIVAHVGHDKVYCGRALQQVSIVSASVEKREYFQLADSS